MVTLSMAVPRSRSVRALSKHEPQPGSSAALALACDAEGTILRWLQDDFRLCPSPSEVVNFLRLLHESNHLKGLTFLAELRGGVALVDRELCFVLHDELRVLHVAAARGADATIILAADTTAELKSLCSRVGSQFGDCAQPCIQMLAAWQKPSANISQVRVQEDFIRMYNDFARLQREHAGQKAQLTRLAAEKDRIMNMAVHDLRSPLGVIALLAGSVSHEARERLTERELEVLGKIVDTAKDMGRALGDMLDASRHAPGSPTLSTQVGDLRALVQDRIDLLAPLAAQKRIALRLHCASALPAIPFDARHMQHVVDNLLGNAFKFSPSKACVDIRLQPGRQGLQMDICDQGPGIPETELGRIFEPFARGSAIATGGEASNGLGLAICRSIIEAHGGRIWAENLPSGGAALRVFLPESRSPARQHGRA